MTHSDKVKHFIGASLQIQRLSPLSSRREAWRHAGRPCWKSRELYIFIQWSKKETHFCTGQSLSTGGASKPMPLMIHCLHQSHTLRQSHTSYSVSFPVGQPFKHMCLLRTKLIQTITMLFYKPEAHGCASHAELAAGGTGYQFTSPKAEGPLALLLTEIPVVCTSSRVSYVF